MHDWWQSTPTWDGEGVLVGLCNSLLLQSLSGLKVAPLPTDIRPIALPVLLPLGTLFSLSQVRGLLTAGERLARALPVSCVSALVGVAAFFFLATKS